jgi:GntR family transcriptional regulator
VMLFSIDEASERPIFAQITDSVRRLIASGDLTTGDRLPPAHSIALGLGVNKHTVLRAYQELRDEGLIDLRRGRGAVVTDSATALGELREDAQRLAARAARLGIRGDTLASLVIQSMPEGAHSR